jgi:SAM-dependent methyltransferase
MTATDTYLLANAQPAAASRFSALADLYDPTTRRGLSELGIQPGWRVWEVGAGGPSLLPWLSRQVGSTGHVLATDIDTSRLTAGAGRVVEVHRHDVAHDPPPGSGFDLIHARLVLVHVPDRDQALARMVTALRPGGVLLIEDYDVALQPLACPPIPHTTDSDRRRANRIREGFLMLLAERGVDLAYGRTLPHRLRAGGLEHVGADAHFPVAMSAVSALETANVRQVKQELISHGHATAAEIEAHLTALARGRLELMLPRSYRPTAADRHRDELMRRALRPHPGLAA